MSAPDRPPSRPSLADAASTAHARPAPAQLAAVAGHGEAHAAYKTARRTLCGLVVAAPCGPLGIPGCQACRAALAHLEALGLVGSGDRAAAHCGARTRRGLPCGRDPLPGGYCPSHRHLAT